MTKPFYTFYKKRGKSILLREKQEDGKTKTLKINNFSPRLWTESDQKTDINISLVSMLNHFNSLI